MYMEVLLFPTLVWTRSGSEVILSLHDVDTKVWTNVGFSLNIQV
jgi:hypothetical protein